MVNKQRKESLMLIDKLYEDIERASKEIIIKAKLNGKLIEIRKKLKDMEARRRQRSMRKASAVAYIYTRSLIDFKIN
jgi:hypothetical protein